eukprot:IDg18983t1
MEQYAVQSSKHRDKDEISVEMRDIQCVLQVQHSTGYTQERCFSFRSEYAGIFDNIKHNKKFFSAAYIVATRIQRAPSILFSGFTATRSLITCTRRALSKPSRRSVTNCRLDERKGKDPQLRSHCPGCGA